MTTWRLAVATSELTLHVELTVVDDGAARYEAVAAGPAVGDGFVVVRDLDLVRPKGPLLEIRGDGIWTELVCETPDEHWSLGLEAFGLRVDDPASEVGERIPVGYDLEWEAAPVDRAAGEGRVFGELLVGRARIPVDARGRFTVTT